MTDHETAFIKQAVLATKDWDTYQAILHNCIGRKVLKTDLNKKTENQEPES